MKICCVFSLTGEYYAVEQWEERRRKAILHSYYKEMRKTAGQACGTEKQHPSISSTGVNKYRYVCVCAVHLVYLYKGNSLC
jgi:hypothetical protein